MLLQIGLAALMAFSVGTQLGMKVKKEPVRKAATPDRWLPLDHKELLKTCGIVCGKDNLKSYDVVYGSCVCKGDK